MGYFLWKILILLAPIACAVPENAFKPEICPQALKCQPQWNVSHFLHSTAWAWKHFWDAAIFFILDESVSFILFNRVFLTRICNSFLGILQCSFSDKPAIKQYLDRSTNDHRWQNLVLKYNRWIRCNVMRSIAFKGNFIHVVRF